MQKVVPIGNAGSEFLLEVPDGGAKTAVIFLPGISGGALSPRFKPVADACLAAGFAIARVSAWQNAADVESKSLGSILDDVSSVVAYLHEQGYDTLFGIGKSFGGAVMLAHQSKSIGKKVLWAPAIGVTEGEGNVSKFLTAPLKGFGSLLELQLGKAFLAEQDAQMLVIHGTADQAIPLSNSEAMVSMLPHAKLFTVEGADHSYTDKNHEGAVIRATIAFLTASS